MSEISAPPLPPPSALFSSSSSSLFALSHPNPSTTGNRTSRRAGGTFSLPVVLSTRVPARLQDPGFRGRAKPALEAALSKDHLDQEDILLAKAREGKGSSAISRRNTVHTSSSSSLQPQLNAHNLSRPTFHHASSSPILPGASSRRNQSPPTVRTPLSPPPRSSTLRVLTTSSSSLLLLSSHLASSPVIERAISPPSPGILLCSSPSSPTNFTPTKIIRNSASASDESSVPSSPVAYTSSLITERPSSTSRILILPLTPSPTIESPSSPTDLRDSYFTDPTTSPISPPPPRKAKPSPALSIALPPPTLVGSAAWMEGHVDTPIVEVDQEEMILCALEEKTAGLGLDFGGLSVGEEGTTTTSTRLGLGGQSLLSSGGSFNFGTGKEDAGKESRELGSGTDEEGDVEG